MSTSQSIHFLWQKLAILLHLTKYESSSLRKSETSCPTLAAYKVMATIAEWLLIRGMEGFMETVIVGVGILISAYLYLRRYERHPPKIDLTDQASIERDGPEVIYTSKLWKREEQGFMKHIYEDSKTLYECFRRGARISSSGKCLGYRESKNDPIQWLMYRQVLNRGKNFGCGLIHIGIEPKSFVGIYSQNSPEWIISEQGLYCFSMTTVPLYDTLGADACSFIISQVEITTVICQDDAKVNLLLDKAPSCLTRIITVADPNEGTVKRAEAQGIKIHRFIEVERLGSTCHCHEEQPPKPGDIATISYTSGTTGAPKGVVLTHESIVACVSSVMFQLGDHNLREDDVGLSYLPLAHMMERCCELAMYMQGGCIVFFGGDIKAIMHDFKTVKPTVVPAVPRLLNRIHDEVMSNVSQSFIKRMLLQLAISSKFEEHKRGIRRKDSIWDWLVFRKLQNEMGGRIRLLVVGSAPSRPQGLTFMRCALGCVVAEGYGQTECVAPCTLTVHGDVTTDHVGPPLPCCCIKVTDVPEMGYFATNGQGEVCVKGVTMFNGYYKDPQRTSEVLDVDGWLHTGDIGTWLKNGTLRIIDRKKDIFKLSQGEYVAPEKIENIYTQSIHVLQAFVYGDSFKSCTVAVIVPEMKTLTAWASRAGVKGDFQQLCTMTEAKAFILEEIVALGKDKGLKSFEQVKDIHLHPDPFTFENGFLTPTMKAIRSRLKSYFIPELEKMYGKLD